MYLKEMLPVSPPACTGSLSGAAQGQISASEVSESTVLEVKVHFTRLPSIMVLKEPLVEKRSVPLFLIIHYLFIAI